MPSPANFVAANQLQIDLSVITAGQMWAKQVHGVYTLLYPWVMSDFVHVQDFQTWLVGYEAHIHGNGNNGSPTTNPMSPADYTDAFAQSYLLPDPALGKMRNGFALANLTVAQLTLNKMRPLL